MESPEPPLRGGEGRAECATGPEGRVLHRWDPPCPSTTVRNQVVGPQSSDWVGRRRGGRLGGAPPAALRGCRWPTRELVALVLGPARRRQAGLQRLRSALPGSPSPAPGRPARSRSPCQRQSPRRRRSLLRQQRRTRSPSACWSPTSRRFGSGTWGTAPRCLLKSTTQQPSPRDGPGPRPRAGWGGV